jgi:hypothetical protein
MGTRSLATVSEAGPRADAGHAFAVLLLRCTRQQRRDVVAMVGRDPLQAADGHRLVFDPAAPAGGLAGAVADSTQNAGETRSTARFTI